METTNLLQPTSLSSNNPCKKILDPSEPCILLGILSGFFVFGYSLVNGNTPVSITSGIFTITGCISECRVRALSIAKKLTESVANLNKENKRLNTEINKFENILGIFGDNVNDIEKTKNDLFKLYDKYKNENDRYESNNLLTLFGLIDKDQNSKLDPDEIKRMSEYIRIVYKQEFDFTKLDCDGDGNISLNEFFEKFRSSSSSSSSVQQKSKIEVKIDTPKINYTGQQLNL